MELLAQVQDKPQLIARLNRELKIIRIFEKRVGQMLQPYKLDRAAKQEVEEKLTDLGYLALIGAIEKETALTPDYQFRKERYLQRYGASSGPEAINIIVGELNQRYNQRNTPVEKWLDLKGLWSDYRAKNQHELAQLQQLAQQAAEVQAHHVARHAREEYAVLLAEEEELARHVEATNIENYRAVGMEHCFDEDYYELARLLSYKSSLYQARGRNSLLWSYQRYRPKGADDPQAVTQSIAALEQSLQNESKYTVQELGQLAREWHHESKLEAEAMERRRSAETAREL